MAASGGRSTPSGYNATFFDTGSTGSYLATSSTGYTAASTGILSIWVNLTSSSNNGFIFSNNTNANPTVTMSLTGMAPRLALQDVTDTYTYVASASSSLSTGTWYNLLLSWNMNFPNGSKIFNLYINGVSALGTIFDGNPAFNVGYQNGPYNVSIPSGTRLAGCVSELYFAPGQFLDFTNPSNVALFYNSGSPVNLGTNGQTPTGTSPAIYWRGLYTNLTNLGTGNTLTAGGDALTACGSAP